MAADTGPVANALRSMSVQPGRRQRPLSESEFAELMNLQNSANSKIL